MIDDRGEPVPWVEVRARARRLFGDGTGAEADPPGEPEQVTESDFDGTYAFYDLADGEYEVATAETELHGAARALVRAGSDAVNLVVARHREVRLQGTVSGADGRPLAGVRVRPVGRPVVAFTDAQGAYELRLAVREGAGRRVLRFEGEGYEVLDLPIGEARWRDPGPVRLDVRLRPVAVRVAVEGRVQDLAGAPIAGETVELVSPSRKRRYSAPSGPDGRFSFAGVEAAGDYQLVVRPRGPYRGFREGGLAIGERSAPLLVTLEPLGLGTLSGRMVDLDGNPIPGFTLWLRGVSAPGQPIAVTGDAEGRFVARPAPDGDVVLETRSFPVFTVTGVDVPPGGDREVTVTLDRGPYTLRGRVLDGYGEPVPGAEIVLSWIHDDGFVRSRSLRKTVAEADGAFAFTRLGPGPHSLSVSAQGFRIARAEHSAAADREAEIEVWLEEAP